MIRRIEECADVSNNRQFISKVLIHYSLLCNTKKNGIQPIHHGVFNLFIMTSNTELDYYSIFL